MPCQVYNDHETVELRTQELDEVTRYLCAVLAQASNPHELIHAAEANGEGIETDELMLWWKRHQEKDAERQAAERERQDRNRTKVRGLAKLTPKEIQALGLV